MIRFRYIGHVAPRHVLDRFMRQPVPTAMDLVARGEELLDDLEDARVVGQVERFLADQRTRKGPEEASS